jgi:hypothetical protein
MRIAALEAAAEDELAEVLYGRATSPTAS